MSSRAKIAGVLVAGITALTIYAITPTVDDHRKYVHLYARWQKDADPNKVQIHYTIGPRSITIRGNLSNTWDYAEEYTDGTPVLLTVLDATNGQVECLISVNGAVVVHDQQEKGKFATCRYGY